MEKGFDKTQRKIIHIDMDAFYASVEQMDFPEYKNKALAVGGGEKRGVVAAASYEARKYGVYSAMSGALAKRKCPHLIFVKPRFDRYREISERIRTIFYDYTDWVEPLSLDEAYLDVTKNKVNQTSATRLAREIRERIHSEIGLTASAGISINKFLAKVASDINKPNGQKTILPEEVLPFLEQLPIQKFHGIGKVTAAKMNALGIFTGKDLKQWSLQNLQNNFGKSGTHFYHIVRGVHNSPVSPNRIRKSVAVERTFETNIISKQQIWERLETLAEMLEKRLNKKEIKGKTLTLKIKYSNFVQQTRSKTVPHYLNHKSEFLEVLHQLIDDYQPMDSVRLLGLSMSKLNTEETKGIWVQLELDFP